MRVFKSIDLLFKERISIEIFLELKLDKNNVIYSGHRRWYSAKEEKIPVLRCMRIKDTFDKKCLTDSVLKRKELDTLSNLN